MPTVDEKQAQYAGEILQIISTTSGETELELTITGNAYGLLSRFVITSGKFIIGSESIRNEIERCTLFEGGTSS